MSVFNSVSEKIYRVCSGLTLRKQLISKKLQKDRESRRGGGLITGAARGGIRAGVVGEIFGDRNFARDAAKVGAIIGGISNSSRRARNRDELYDIAFNDCMRGATVTPY
ncbi:MAG TPA: hypothetical protein DCF68_06980 [Cyanothece sp. UBA12306]|nr:hypothetical protein [Cyanothece sp. UBA12306]